MSRAKQEQKARLPSVEFETPVNFVAPRDAIWPELLDWAGNPMDPSILSKRSGGILHSWILRTYYQLRIAGYCVDLSTQPRVGAVNFVSVRDFGRRQKRADTFIVVPQGDAHDSMLADFRIFQNGLREPSVDTAAIWHWPQPGIIPRDPDRQETMKNLSYKGRLLNLEPVFRSDIFLAKLTKMEINFEIDAYEGLRGDHSWNDYRTTDAVLAVRNLTLYDAQKKPASKLVNAWIAETPAILGPEPAFQELRQSDHDYIEVRTPRDALEAIDALRGSPDLFRRMVETGRRRRLDFSEDRLTRLWVDTIKGPITEAFIRWNRTPLLTRRLISLRSILLEKGAKARDSTHIRSGPRLLDENNTGAQPS